MHDVNLLTAAVPLLSAVLGAVVGGFVVHRLTLRREVLGAQRTQRVAFLLDAYRKLLDASERPRITPERRDNLESAFADIMLLGGPDEIAAAHRFEVEFVQNRAGSLDPVITALRDNLRRELGIVPVSLPSPYNLRLTLDGEEVESRRTEGSEGAEDNTH